MKTLKNFKAFEQAIYSANWKEEYDEEFCELFGLEPGDEFEFSGGSPKYIQEEKPTSTAYYRGVKSDYVYFSYEPDGLVYKITKEELEEKFISKL